MTTRYIRLDSEGETYGDGFSDKMLSRLNDKMKRAAEVAGVECVYDVEPSYEGGEIDWWNDCPNWYNGTVASIGRWLKEQAA